MIFFYSLIFLLQLSNDWSGKVNTKVNSALAKTFGSEEIELTPFPLALRINSDLEKGWEDTFYRIHNKQGVALGYIFVDQGPSMKNIFDYCVIFDNDLEILNTKVLIYREQHGRQIGTKRWLSQFFGYSLQNRPSLGVDIDGVSGATISCRNFTNSIHDLLEQLDELKKNGAFN